MTDILFKTDDWVFSYRVAGICIQNGKVLLQTTTGEDRSFAFPGGHVAFGETNANALIREFREELGADITVGDLKWVGEVFFPWGKKPCHQICLYYLVQLQDHQMLKDGAFLGKEHLEGKSFDLEFRWIPLESVGKTEIYPTNAKELLKHLEDGVQHFLYKE